MSLQAIPNFSAVLLRTFRRFHSELFGGFTPNFSENNKIAPAEGAGAYGVEGDKNQWRPGRVTGVAGTAGVDAEAGGRCMLAGRCGALAGGWGLLTGGRQLLP